VLAAKLMVSIELSMGIGKFSKGSSGVVLFSGLRFGNNLHESVSFWVICMYAKNNHSPQLLLLEGPPEAPPTLSGTGVFPR